ncbi:MAG: hypothetical protein UU21_C0007G0038 [Candidatus Levybacteria bacterium GW2011_GWA2_40_8]|nr:MAG: hypothetical protein UU21_C0007G0038 [Candidatus Levybacteria bacterium GW2011_GWA2_40_8]
MITVPEATEKIIKRSRYLSEALSKDIINISGLARYIRPEIESMLIKKVSLSSVIMALKRMRGNIYPDTPYQEIFQDAPQITVKTGLAFLISNKLNEAPNSFSHLSQDSKSYVILGSKQELTPYNQLNAKLIYPVASIAVSLPIEAFDTPGIYYFLIKSLAWERINILYMFTSPSEITIVVRENTVQRTLEVLRSIFEDLS